MWTKLLTPGLDNTRLFISLTAGAGTRCMEPSLFISNPVPWTFVFSLSVFYLLFDLFSNPERNHASIIWDLPRSKTGPWSSLFLCFYRRSSSSTSVSERWTVYPRAWNQRRSNKEITRRRPRSIVFERELSMEDQDGKDGKDRKEQEEAKEFGNHPSRHSLWLRINPVKISDLETFSWLFSSLWIFVKRPKEWLSAAGILFYLIRKRRIVHYLSDESSVNPEI